MSKKQLMVRVCPDCGTVYGESKKMCEQCGVRLDDPVPQSEGLEQGDDIVEAKTRRANLIARNSKRPAGDIDFDPGIEVNTFRKVFGTLAVIALVALIAISVPAYNYIASDKTDWMTIVFPTVSDFAKRAVFIFNAPAIIFMIFCIFECFAPNKFWIFRTAYESTLYDRPPMPSSTYLDLMAGFEAVSVILTYILLIFEITLFL